MYHYLLKLIYFALNNRLQLNIHNHFKLCTSVLVMSWLVFPVDFADYLLSNNHVNSIIVHKFDFSDEEVMAYYISFLKTLSFKLNSHTIHFFYNEVNGDSTVTPSTSSIMR